MTVLGVIPARWASTRLPGKSLVNICGKPLIQWVVEAASRAEALDGLIVATDDRRIIDCVEKLGVKAVMTRSNHVSGTDRIAEAAGGSSADVVVNIQGDEPFVDPLLVDRVVEKLASGGEWDMSTAAAPVRDGADLEKTSVVKVVFSECGRALYFSRYAIPFVRDTEEPPVHDLHWRHIGLYAYTRDFLERLVSSPPCALEKAEKLEQLRALHIGGKIAVVAAEEAGIGVDTPEDVAYAESILEKGHG